MKAEIAGQRFGKLEAIRPVKKDKRGNIQWLCKCDCGSTKLVAAAYLIGGRTKSCGCMRRETKDITGTRSGKLVALYPTDEMKHGKTVWMCQCDCGGTRKATVNDILFGYVTSCGCANIHHGLCHTKLYNVWKSMKQRCNNKNNHAYKWYGGKGVKVCDEWNGSHSYENFYKWAMASGYKEGLTIDRIDPDGNYEPNNCRWITISEQQRNRSNSLERRQSCTHSH